MITSRIPKARKRESVISSSVRPAISTSALGRESVSGRRRVPRPAARIMAFIGAFPANRPAQEGGPYNGKAKGLSLERSPLAQILQLKMADRHFHAVPGAQTLRQLLREIDGAMLAAGAAKGDHQIFEAALLITADAGVHQRQDTREKLVHAFLLIEIVDDRGVFASQSFEALFASWIGEAAAIEDESAAVSGLVCWQAAMKGKTENAHDQVIRFGSEALQFLRGQHAFEGVHQRRERNGQPDVVKQPAQVFQRIGHALQKMSFALIKAAKAISAQGLQDADANVGIVVPHERFALKLDETGEPVEIMIEQLLAEFRRQVGLGIVQKRSDVVLQRAFAAALIIQKKGLGVAQHDVAGLEIPVEKVIAGGA